jgi:hypothetical protein
MAKRNSQARPNGESRANRRSGGTVDAPGKQHRKPPPSIHGAKHSDEAIAKSKTAEEKRRWARD